MILCSFGICMIALEYPQIETSLNLHDNDGMYLDRLETRDDMAASLEAALEDGDPSLVAATLGDIVRAKGMVDIARENGLGLRLHAMREHL